MSMNPDVKAAWVAALKSPAFTQCKGQLQIVEEDGSKSFCCLGVLREIVDPNHTIEESVPESPLPNTTQFGLSQGLTQKQLNVFMTMNDEGDASFSKIAEAVEAFL